MAKKKKGRGKAKKAEQKQEAATQQGTPDLQLERLKIEDNSKDEDALMDEAIKLAAAEKEDRIGKVFAKKHSNSCYHGWCWRMSFKENEGEEGKGEKRKERYAASEEKNELVHCAYLRSEEEDTFLCSVHDVVEGNEEEFASPSSHNITFSPVDFSASTTSFTLLEGGC
eukprot:scaffold8854_cov97-Skeletonema_dohrnii-CCMP3373.AAC.7